MKFRWLLIVILSGCFITGDGFGSLGDDAAAIRENRKYQECVMMGEGPVPDFQGRGVFMAGGSCSRRRSCTRPRTYVYPPTPSPCKPKVAGKKTTRPSSSPKRSRPSPRTTPSRATVKPSDLFNRSDPYAGEKGYHLRYTIAEDGAITIDQW